MDLRSTAYKYGGVPVKQKIQRFQFQNTVLIEIVNASCYVENTVFR